MTQREYRVAVFVNEEEFDGQVITAEDALKQALTSKMSLVSSVERRDGIKAEDLPTKFTGLQYRYVHPHYECRKLHVEDLPKTREEQMADQLGSMACDEARIRRDVKEALDNLRWIARRRKQIAKAMAQHERALKAFDKLGARGGDAEATAQPRKLRVKRVR